MNVVNRLNDIATRKSLVKIQGGAADLVEEGVMQVRINGLTENSTILKLEKFGLNGVTKNGKCCDFAIVTDKGNGVELLLVALKKNLVKTNLETAKSQLRWGESRAMYILGMCKMSEIPHSIAQLKYVSC